MSCRLVTETAKVPARAVSAVVPTTKSDQLDPAAVQYEVQRFADDFSGRTAVALDEYARRVGTAEAKTKALTWKVSLGASAFSIASGPNSTANLFDLIVLATFTRVFLEERSDAAPNRAVFQPWLDTTRSLESNAWSLAESMLKPEVCQSLREAIRLRQETGTLTDATLFERPESLTSFLREKPTHTERSGGVLDLVSLDPMAGLDPAVREVTQTRLFAERALFTMQRMPFLVRWQAELLADRLFEEAGLASAMTNVASLTESADRFSHAAETTSQVASQLPDRIAAERQAVLTALETQEGKLSQLSSEIGRALDAGKEMSDSLNTTLVTFDALMKRFGVGEPDAGAPTESGSPPFSILDYARTAEKVAETARELDVLLKDAQGTLDSPAVGNRLQELSAVARGARAEANAVLNRAFFLGAGLILFGFCCALVYRRLVDFLGRRPQKI